MSDWLKSGCAEQLTFGNTLPGEIHSSENESMADVGSLPGGTLSPGDAEKHLFTEALRRVLVAVWPLSRQE